MNTSSTSYQNNVFIIAEAGVNHNGNLTTALQLIDAAADAKANAVKFQTFRAIDLVRSDTPKAHYQQKATVPHESQFEMIRKLELDQTAHRILFEHCQRRDILFLSSPFDLFSIDLLTDLGLTLFKIPSGEITNLPYLLKIGSLNTEIILSTGMSTLKEIADALHVLQTAGPKNHITLLHCNTEYPTPMVDANLRAITTLAETFMLPVGYSDHTLGTEASIAAVALGATIIEKHFTLDRTMAGPDHNASLEPDELGNMVKAIRNVSIALGDGIKQPSTSELHNIAIARKSIVAARDIQKGELFTEGNLTTKRPAWGISPMRWETIINTTASKNYEKDEFIVFDDSPPTL
ncbi:N-acetylneuraminate synthase [uncultured Desulfobulbus sp.]|uniref:N-acetylneuraminate synthase n=1 Tax=uncultured Desulfobulbus sp. TaxID=239745 RepID=UPI0029C75AD2|nr:N-acetylneuraminate synthase [uncultured Desulfobulbus sp.]